MSSVDTSSMCCFDEFYPEIYRCLKTVFENAKKDVFEETKDDFPDFGGANHVCYNPDGDLKKLTLSLSVPYFEDLVKQEVLVRLRQEYGDYIQEEPDKNFDVSLRFDLTNLPEDVDPVCKKAAQLRRNCYAYFYHRYFQIHRDLRCLPGFVREGVIRQRSNDTTYVHCVTGQLTIILSILIYEDSDLFYAKLAASLFYDFCCNLKVLVTIGTPIEIRERDDVLKGKNVIYVQFLVSQAHSAHPDHDKIIRLIACFRDFLFELIGNAKDLLQQNMVDGIQKYMGSLNAAIEPKK